MQGFYRSFNGDFHKIACPHRPRGLRIAGRYIRIVPAELEGDEFFSQRGERHESRQAVPWLLQWLRPVEQDGELVLESADPYIPLPEEIRSDGALVILSASLRNGQFALWRFPKEATLLGETMAQGQLVLETANRRRYLLEMPVGCSAECTVVDERGKIVRLMRFACQNVTHSGWRGGRRFDRSGQPVYKWSEADVFWPWIMRTSERPSFGELPDDVQAAVRRTIRR